MTIDGIFTVYSKEEDITFIMKETEDSLSVIGFYFGEPDPECTKEYAGKTTAVFVR